MRQGWTILMVILWMSGCGKKEDHHAHEARAVQLDDNGNKWKADAATKTGMEGLHQAVRSFRSDVKNPSITDYQRLHGELNAMVDGIFKSCTMTGEAHHQLHNYLTTVVASVKTLEGTDGHASEDALQTLERHLGEFHSFFE